MSEMTRLQNFRSAVPVPTDLRAEEERLMAALVADEPKVHKVRPRRLYVGLAAGIAAAAVAAAAGALTVSDEPGGVVHTMPVAHVQLLQQAADAAGHDVQELHPKPGQFLVYKSQTMDPVEGGGGRYLSRSVRTIWLPVSGDATGGVLRTDVLEPKPYPGWPVPPEARQGAGKSSQGKAADFDQRAEWLRNDFTYLSRLPAKAPRMYEHLYSHLGKGPQADAQAWQNLGGMLTEAYMPAAQRKALFQAASAIPGVTAVGKAVDAAGRTGVAVALTLPGSGERQEYIFDPKSYQYLGERIVVTDAAIAKAPVGSVLTSSAQLSVRVADSAPAR